MTTLATLDGTVRWYIWDNTGIFKDPKVIFLCILSCKEWQRFVEEYGLKNADSLGLLNHLCITSSEGDPAPLLLPIQWVTCPLLEPGSLSLPFQTLTIRPPRWVRPWIHALQWGSIKRNIYPLYVISDNPYALCVDKCDPSAIGIFEYREIPSTADDPRVRPPFWREWGDVHRNTPGSSYVAIHYINKRSAGLHVIAVLVGKNVQDVNDPHTELQVISLRSDCSVKETVTIRAEGSAYSRGPGFHTCMAASPGSIICARFTETEVAVFDYGEQKGYEMLKISASVIQSVVPGDGVQDSSYFLILSPTSGSAQLLTINKKKESSVFVVFEGSEALTAAAVSPDQKYWVLCSEGECTILENSISQRPRILSVNPRGARAGQTIQFMGCLKDFLGFCDDSRTLQIYQLKGGKLYKRSGNIPLIRTSIGESECVERMLPVSEERFLCCTSVEVYMCNIRRTM